MKMEKLKIHIKIIEEKVCRLNGRLFFWLKEKDKLKIVFFITYSIGKFINTCPSAGFFLYTSGVRYVHPRSY